jgi:membrane-associated phospholipid phosphatase
VNGTREQEFLRNEGIGWGVEGEVLQKNAGGVSSFEARAGAIEEALRSEWEALWAASGPFEWVALTYLAVSSGLIVIFGQNLAHPGALLVVQAGWAAAILALCGMEARIPERPIFSLSEREILRSAQNDNVQSTRKVWHFWRYWYPHLFFLFCFEELGYLMHLVMPEWQDAKLLAFDRWLTGVNPTIWLEHFATPGRNEFMQFAYITYFMYLLVLGGILYHRKDWRAYWSVITYSAAAYGIGYLIAIFFPVESPWFAMAGAWHGELRGGVFTAVISFIEHYGRVRGAAFPSEHVAGSVAALWGAWRHRRWLFWVMLPLAACMCVSTVWGRYHYVADVFCGVVTGTVGYVVGAWVMRKVDSRQSIVESRMKQAEV